MKRLDTTEQINTTAQGSGRSRPKPGSTLLCFFFLILSVCTYLLPDAFSASIDEIQQRKTTETLNGVSGLKQSDIENILNRLKNSSYKTKRIFLAFCNLPDTGKENITEMFNLVDTLSVPFAFIPLLEHFTSFPDASISSTRQLLARLEDSSFVSEKVLAELAHFQSDDSAQIFSMIDLVEELDEAGQWAVQSLFKNLQPDSATSFHIIALLARMSEQQCRAAEQLFRIPHLKDETVPTFLLRLSQVTNQDAVNIRALFMQDLFSADALPFWLNGYFARPPAQRDGYFRTLTTPEKNILLAAFSEGATTFIWRINNLHDVTDAFGREIGSGRLAGYSSKGISSIFRQLHPLSQQQYGSVFYNGLKAGDRATAVSALRQATGHSRKQTAEELSSANIYTLLANGSELYDSSFRDILVPILKRRIASQHHDRLLDFLVSTDSGNIYISDFITNLAQKGKLTTFFPQDSKQQKKILKLVAASALYDEESLILFSATFSRLLQALQPAGRSYLLKLLLETIRKKETAYSDQAQVILQYYIGKYPQLLSSRDKQEIEALVNTRGRIDFTPYIAAPFDQWREDGRLVSLSVFQDDDDGRSSYLSYCRTLAENGYKPALSEEYRTVTSIDAMESKTQHLINNAPIAPSPNLSTLFRLSSRSSLAIDWKKRVNNVEIIHTVYVYSGETRQKQLLTIFLQAGHEMFAQRGHSYWRYEQLFQPLETLIKEKVATSAIFDAKQRFISLGSCGGIRAYSQLNRIFRNKVDIMATIGTGKAVINNPYNQLFLEFIAKNDDMHTTWQEVEQKFTRIFAENLGGDYIQPGSLPAILHKMRDLEAENNGTD